MRAFDSRRCPPLGTTFITVDAEHFDDVATFEGNAKKRSHSSGGYTPHSLLGIQASCNDSLQCSHASIDDEFYPSETWPDTDDEDVYDFKPYRHQVYGVCDEYEISTKFSAQAPKPTASVSPPGPLPTLLSSRMPSPPGTTAASQEKIRKPPCGIWAPKEDGSAPFGMASGREMIAMRPYQPMSACAPQGKTVMTLATCVLRNDHADKDSDRFCEAAGTGACAPSPYNKNSMPFSVSVLGENPPLAAQLLKQNNTTSRQRGGTMSTHEPHPPMATNEGRNLTSEENTTVMVRNLPKELSQQTFLSELDGTGFAGMYDFCYIPRSFATGLNQGIAFINFKSFLTVAVFTKAWSQTRHFDMEPNKPHLNFSAAAVQGLQANLDKWSTPRLRRIRNPNHLPFVDRSSLDITQFKQVPVADKLTQNMQAQSMPGALEAQSCSVVKKPPLVAKVQSSARILPVGRVMP